LGLRGTRLFTDAILLGLVALVPTPTLAQEAGAHSALGILPMGSAFASIVLSIIALFLSLKVRRVLGSVAQLEQHAILLERSIKDQESLFQTYKDTLRQDVVRLEQRVNKLDRSLAQGDAQSNGDSPKLTRLGEKRSAVQAAQPISPPPSAGPSAKPLHSDGGLTVKDFLRFAEGAVTRIAFDAANRVFVPSGDGRFELLRCSQYEGINCLIPGISYFETASQYQLHYGIAFDCHAPGGGDIYVLRPAEVTEAPNGYILVRKGELRVE
jgi:hypothetical protein